MRYLQSKPFIKFIVFFVLSLFVSSCGPLGFNSNNNLNSSNIEKIEIAPLLGSVAEGVSIQMSATAFYADGSKTDVTKVASWTSSDTNISTIDNNGLLKTLSPGSHTISINYNQYSASNDLVINNATLTSLNISPANPSIVENTNIKMTVIGVFNNGSLVDVSNQVSWSIENSSVLTQVENNQFNGTTSGESVLTASLNNVTANTIVDVKAGTLNTIQIIYDEDSNFIGSDIPLQAIGIYDEGFKQDLTDQVNWSISDEALLSLESSEIATLLDVGEVTLTAQLGNIKSSESITIIEQAPTLQSLTIPKNETILSVNDRLPFHVIGTYSDNSTINLTTAATWQSSDTNTLQISNNLSFEGEALALQSGASTITASVIGITTSLDITVSATVLQKIEITLQRQTIAIATSLNLVATGIYSDNTKRDLTNLVAWQSQNPDRIHVSNENENRGTITALAAGPATISASLDGIEDIAEIKVSDSSLIEINIEGPDLLVHTGLTSAFTAIGIFGDGRKQDITHLVEWTSSDPTIVAMNSKSSTPGSFSALATGTATISASYASKLKSISIETRASTIDKIVIHSAKTSIAEGTTIQVSATAIYSDNTSTNITTPGHWSSDNSQILSISNINGSKGLISAVGPGDATIKIEYLNITATFMLNVSDATITAISITPQNINLANNTHQGLVATGIFSNEKTQDITQSVLWSSDKPDIVFMSNADGKNGEAYALNAGEVVISAKLGNLSTETTINVNSDVIDGINIQFEGNTIIAKDSSKTLTAEGNYSSGATQNLSQQVTWQSTDTSICTISTAANNAGVLIGRAAGSCTVTARYNEVYATALFTISEANLQSITITPSDISLAKGTQQQLHATGQYSDGTTQDLTNQVTWQSLSPAISIDNQGLLKALTIGSGVVQVDLLNISLSINITVNAEKLESISISPISANIIKGLDHQFIATGTYSDNSTQDITQSVLWESTDPLIISVNQNGVGSGLSTGTAAISAKMESISNTINTVVEINPTAPISMSASAAPYVILNNGIDETTISIKVLAVDGSQLVADGTQINLSVLDNTITLDSTTAVTSNGVASFTFTSTYNGIITIQAAINDTDISNNISIYSTDNFAKIITRGVLLSAKVIDNVVQIKSKFGLAIVNYANRPFNLVGFVLGTENKNIYIENLNNATFNPGQYIFRGWETDLEQENSFKAAFFLNEPKTNANFQVGVSYNLPANY